VVEAKRARKKQRLLRRAEKLEKQAQKLMEESRKAAAQYEQLVLAEEVSCLPA
jgi:hypothetical protein